MEVERSEKRFLTCPVCGRMLLKCDGVCNLEITCGKCNRSLAVHVDDERIIVLEDRRISGKAVRGSVTIRKNKKN